MFLIVRERLLNDLSKKKEDLINVLLQANTIEDYASYRYINGRIRGINDSIDIVREMFKEDEN
jgi:hypothetical protein